MYYKEYSIDKYAKGGIIKDKLLGSSPNYDGILKLLKQFFYSPNIFLTEGEIGGNYYVINNSKGIVKDYYVFFSKGRYRFFEKNKSNSDANILEKDYKLKQRISNNKKEIANLKKSTTEIVENENTLKYALQNWVSSGRIASMTDITEYEEINDIRLEAIKILDKEGNKFYSINGLKDILQKAKESLKLKTNDKSINYAKNIKEGNKYGDWTLTYYKPISETIGAIRLVNQKTYEKIELIGDSLNRTWFTSYNGITIEEKNPNIVIEKVLELANKVLDESKKEDIEQVEIKKDTDIDYAKTIKEGNKYGDWSLMKFDPIKFNDDGSLSGGYIRLVNQDTLDKLEILNDLNLRRNKYFISYGGVQIIDKNPITVIEKVLKLANKVIDESKTEDIEQVEINKGSNIDKELKSLKIALKYSGANTRLRIEKEISSLKIAQKYEKPSKIDKAESKLEGNKAAKIVYDNLPRILSLSIEEIVDPFPKETYNDRLVDLALQIDKTMLTEAHAEWKNNQIRERNVKNILAKRMKNDYYSTLELLELVKTIPKYLHEYKGSIEEIYDNVKAGKMNSDDAAIYLNEEGIEVTYEIYDRLRDMEKKYQKNLRGLEVHDIITVKGKNGNKDFPANFRGYTNDGKLVVVYEGGKQMTINSDEYY
jgi:hypothetical protein